MIPIELAKSMVAQIEEVRRLQGKDGFNNALRVLYKMAASTKPPSVTAAVIREERIMQDAKMAALAHQARLLGVSVEEILAEEA